MNSNLRIYWSHDPEGALPIPETLRDVGGSFHIRAVFSVPIGARIYFRTDEDYPWCVDELRIVGSENPQESFTEGYGDTFRDYSEGTGVREGRSSQGRQSLPRLSAEATSGTGGACMGQHYGRRTHGA